MLLIRNIYAKKNLPAARQADFWGEAQANSGSSTKQMKGGDMPEHVTEAQEERAFIEEMAKLAGQWSISVNQENVEDILKYSPGWFEFSGRLYRY